MNNLHEIIPKETALKKIPHHSKSALKKSQKAIMISFVMIVVMVIGSLMLLRRGIGIGATALLGSYNSAYDVERDKAYQILYDSAYDKAEKSYHVSNKVVISIGNLKESQKLEVLKANDVEFILEDRDNNSGKVTAWLEVEGEGTFIVDLQAAEFIIDNERQYVLVRIPNPELTNITIIETTKRLFADDWLDGSYSEGVVLRVKQQNEAALQIQKALRSNQYIFNNAKGIAERMISNLVKQFNPDIPELTVDVEFME